MSILLVPPIAFLIYLALAGALLGLGRALAGPGRATPLKSSLYASGEQAQNTSVPGYRPFFVSALFFAVLHLGVLVLSSVGNDLAPAAGAYLIGLALALLALLLG